MDISKINFGVMLGLCMLFAGGMLTNLEGMFGGGLCIYLKLIKGTIVGAPKFYIAKIMPTFLSKGPPGLLLICYSSVQ
jgi:ABC-type microcin C transport system permease subunit YejE